jgi:hypothetical protein
MRKPGAIALVLGLCVATWAQADPGGPRASTARIGPVKRPVVTLSGSVSGLYPGAIRRLPVTFVNRTRSKVVLQRMTVRVLLARRGCEARELVVSRLPRRLRISRRRRARAWLTVWLSRTAPNACQGARFTLRVRARVRRP